MPMLWVLTAAACADYMTPEQAGFHHCVLIYDAGTQTADDLLPHVAHLDAEGRADRWLFDAFLCLPSAPGPATRESYHSGTTNRADWEALQEAWFVEGRGLHALQEAVTRAEEVLGPRDRPLEVILTIPYPSAAQAEFGDVDGDGETENLSQDAVRETVVDWYVRRALSAWGALTAPDLRLWGFYWTNEGIGASDAEIVSRSAGLVHGRGHRFLWIPWFRAPGFERWREFGFDVAILQPNYAFLSDHRGKVRSDRLTETAALAESLGMGVEMEIGYAPERDLREREIFRDYLAFGAPDRCGYQAAALAYYQSLRTFPNLLRAEDPDARRVYDELAAYVHGEPVARPTGLAGAEVKVDGRSLAAGDGGKAAATMNVGAEAPIIIELPHPRAVGEVELGCVRGEAAWGGLVWTELREAGKWRAGGWAVARVPRRETDGAVRRAIAVPVFAEGVEALRVHLAPDEMQPPLAIDEVTLTCGPPRLDWLTPNLAYGRPYTVAPDFARNYPDRGGMLTDGEASTEGWSQGRSVGWWGDELTVRVDLGAVRAVDRVVLHCDGGGSAAVSFPEWVRVELSETEAPAPPTAYGLGAPPPTPSASATQGAESLRLGGERAVGDGTTTAWGCFEVSLEGRLGRYVMAHLSHNAWLMLSEVEVWSQGVNVARGAPYLFTPSPTAAAEVRYADDGQLLTDGCVATGFLPRRLAGWSRAEEVVLTVDLGATRDVREVIVHTLGGGAAGILAPAGARLELSEDGEAYRTAAEGALSDPGGQVSVPLTLPLSCGQVERGRFVRLKLEPSAGWTMVSEIVVR